MTFDFQYGDQHTNQYFFVNFENNTYYSNDPEFQYHQYWMAISPNYVSLHQKTDSKQKNGDPVKKENNVATQKGQYHQFKAISKNGFTEFYINDILVGSLERIKFKELKWRITEDYSNGLRIRNLKIISGQ